MADYFKSYLQGLAASWVRHSALAWQLVVDLALQTDEHGQVLVNVTDYCARTGLQRSAVQRVLKKLAESNVIRHESDMKTTRITFLGLVGYSVGTITNRHDTDINMPAAKKAESEKKKSSPCTPLKEEEGEKKEGEQQQPALRFFASLSLSEEERENVLEQSRAALQKRVQAYTRRHREIPAAAVEEFTDYWAEEQKVTDSEGRLVGFCLAWDAEERFSVARRLPGFLRTGTYQHQRRQTTLQRIGGPKAKTPTQLRNEQLARQIREEEMGSTQRRWDEAHRRRATVEQIREILGDRCII